MKTDIVSMGDVIEEAVAAEERGEDTPALLASVGNVTGRTLCGFSVPVEDVHNDKIQLAREERLRIINRYRDNARELVAELAAVQIKPLAIITLKAWDQIVERTGLLTFKPSVNGHVSTNDRIVRELRGSDDMTPRSFIPAAILGVLAAVALGVLMYGVDPGNETFVAMGRVVLWAILAVTANVTIFGIAAAIDSRVNRRGFRARVVQYLKTHSHAEVLRDLSFNGCFGQAGDYGNYAEVVFPPAPLEIISLLKRSRGLDGRNDQRIQVAAEAGAVQFKGGMEELFDRGLEHILYQEEQMRHDPILYMVKGHAVAIIGQYGDFPIEREVVEAVLNSEHLL